MELHLEIDTPVYKENPKVDESLGFVVDYVIDFTIVSANILDD